ncbi:MAG TPA: alpha/beta hydrolase-fold protein [Tepidisphaeraceae bacterium]|nr:alpha/beta hydrolase-fold protein [Tepidisphaeraceae bacterium]
MRLPYFTLVLILPAVALRAEHHVTVVTKEGRQSGALSAEQMEVKTNAGVTKVPLAEVASVHFGDTDVVHTRQGKRVKGTVKVEGWVLKEKDAERPVGREGLRFLVPQASVGRAKKGQIVDAASGNGMTYHVRLPEKYDPAKGGPAIVLLHGSNANSADYVKGVTQRWPKVAADYVLIGIDGEWPAGKDPDGPPAYNYTYVNFVGKSKYKGFPGTDRESPALVAETLAEIKEQLKLFRVFVTGHSQGGFLAYSCLMNYPDLFDGAMPIAAGLIFQCEPSAYEDADIRRRQRERPLAIVHGEQDPLVSVSMGKAAYESFLADGFPMLRLFAAKGAGHAFISLPFEEAIRWLESMTVDDPRALLKSAERAFAAREYRDACAYLRRAQDLDKKKASAAAAGALRRKIEQLAAKPAKSLEAAIRKNDGTGWVSEFDSFRRQFEFTDAAAGVMAGYNKLRAVHEPAAEKRWSDARRAFSKGDREQGYRICEEIVKEHYASSYFRYAKQTLEGRRAGAP